MKLSTLRLMAFGPFTDAELDFSKSAKGLNIIFGPNEAGKSTSLRAIRYLLFGFPTRLSDDFLHPYDKLRLGGRVEENGSALEFVRRKTNKNPLRDSDDQNTIPESSLSAFMVGLDAERFRKMFGIDHEELRRGGEDIVAGRGDVGEILFSASTGIADLHSIAKRLKQECEERFSPSAHAKTPSLNKSLLQLATSRQRLKELSLPSSQWAQIDRSLKESQSRKLQIERDLEEATAARAREQRIRDSLEPLSRRAELLAKLQPLENVPRLSAEFGQNWREIVAAVKSAEQQQQDDRVQIQRLESELAARKDVTEWIARAGEIDALQLALGKHNKAVADRADLVRDQKQLDAEIVEILRQLGHSVDLSNDEFERLRITEQQVARITELSQQYQKLTAQSESARDQRAQIEKNLARLDAKGGEDVEPEDPEPFRKALSQAANHRALEQQIKADTAELAKLSQEVERELRALKLATDHDAARKLVPPSLETIQKYERDLNAAQITISDAQKAKRTQQERLIQLEREIELLRTKGEIPTTEEVEQARARREQGWQLVLEAWQNLKASPTAAREYIESCGAADLADAYARSVARVDELADRRWREAERVAQLSSLLVDRNETTRRLELAEQTAASAQSEWNALDQRWKDLWTSILLEVGSPREMSHWHKAFHSWLEKADREQSFRERIEALGEECKKQKSKLVKQCKPIAAKYSQETLPSTASFGELLDWCEAACDSASKSYFEWRDRKRERQRLQEELHTASLLCESAERKKSDWHEQWKQAIASLQLQASATPAEVNAVVVKTNELFKKRDFSSSIGKRIYGIDRDRNEFFAAALALAKKVAPDLCSLAGDMAAAEMSTQLVKARDIKKETELKSDQLRALQKRAEQNDQRITHLHNQLELLCKEARCTKPEDFLKAEQLYGEKLRLEAELNKTEEKLRYIGKGHSIEELQKEIAESDNDRASFQIDRLAERIETLQQERNAVTLEIGGIQQQVKMMDGRGDAAQARAQMEEQLAEIHDQAREYAQLRLGYVALLDTIERFRQQNQGPILTRAAEIFRKLTCDSFRGLEVEQTDDGPLLVGIRDGKSSSVRVDGMSDGTTDQLYLSLRLASLHHYLDAHAAVPFIVDDILIHFDDTRSAAALEALAELSARTQVFFFTHHEHLLLLAEKRLKTSQFAVHRLPSR